MMTKSKDSVAGKCGHDDRIGGGERKEIERVQTGICDKERLRERRDPRFEPPQEDVESGRPEVQG